MKPMNIVKHTNEDQVDIYEGLSAEITSVSKTIGMLASFVAPQNGEISFDNKMLLSSGHIEYALFTLEKLLDRISDELEDLAVEEMKKKHGNGKGE